MKKTKVKEKKIKDKVLDVLWSQKLRSKGYCEYCLRKDTLNAHHVFSRSNKSVRWDLENGVCLCAGHHVFGNWSAHKNPIEFIEWLRDKRGEKWYQELRRRAQKTVQCDQIYRKKIKILLESQLKEIQ